MATFDIILDSNQELEATLSGDFVVGDNTNNLIAYIVVSNTGAYKEFPLLGVGIERYLNAQIQKSIVAKTIRQQLRSDVFASASIDLSNYPEGIQIDDTLISFGN